MVDVLVIGRGNAALCAALTAAEAGRSVRLVEAAPLGGDAGMTRALPFLVLRLRPTGHPWPVLDNATAREVAARVFDDAPAADSATPASAPSPTAAAAKRAAPGRTRKPASGAV